MSASRRFLFDVSFDEPDKPAAVRAAPEPTFTQAELATARAEAEAESRTQALADAAAMTETRIAEAVEALDRAVRAATEARAAIVEAVEQDAIALVRQCLAQALPVLCRREPLAEFEAFIVRTLAEALDEPRLVVRVADGLFDAVQQRLAPLAKANGYGGKIIVLADAALAEGDGRVEWADGGAERDMRRFTAECDAILNRALVTAPPPPPTDSQETQNG